MKITKNIVQFYVAWFLIKIYKEDKMKRTYLIGSLIVLGFLAGCVSKTDMGNTQAYGLKNAPSWVLQSPEGILSATSSAKIKNNNISFATTEATQNARVEIASQISTRIESKFKQLTNATEDNVSNESIQAIRNSVNQTLAGSKRINTWISEDGVLWVLVKVDKLDTKLLQDNLLQNKALDKASAKALSQAVDEIIDGE